jgi:hypothetical protein
MKDLGLPRHDALGDAVMAFLKLLQLRQLRGGDACGARFRRYLGVFWAASPVNTPVSSYTFNSMQMSKSCCETLVGRAMPLIESGVACARRQAA